MTEADIRKYASLMNELELTALEIDEAKGTFRLERQPQPAISVQPTVGVGAVSAQPQMTEAIPQKREEREVTSPIVGIFYTSPMENADPYVQVGDQVKKGDVLCTVEAMKLMNDIAAEADGVITEVCVTNGQLVEYGTVLFKMEVWA